MKEVVIGGKTYDVVRGFPGMVCHRCEFWLEEKCPEDEQGLICGRLGTTRPNGLPARDAYFVKKEVSGNG